MNQEIIIKDGKHICPNCGSKRVTEIVQAVLEKMLDANTGKIINPYTGKRYMSNRVKAMVYDAAGPNGAGCWLYECRKCKWQSKLYTE